MKYCPVVLLALCAISSAEINPEYKQRVQTALATCNNEAKLEKEVILKILTEEELPANQNEKCFTACVMKDLGMIADGQLDAEETKRQNREKYTGDDLIKADNTVQKCTDSTPKDLEDECELAFQLMKCKRDEKRALVTRFVFVWGPSLKFAAMEVEDRLEHVSALRCHLQPRVLIKLYCDYPQAEEGVQAPKHAIPLHDEEDDGNGYLHLYLINNLLGHLRVLAKIFIAVGLTGGREK
ncbi:hypothetical protein AAG570_008573 [Ranatra chinensis]|uniref:Uncharacterized protein n=1 Tax=Ranatra chinensis TaxID=642074 RepID=A0ABD0YRA2_9HEMI